MQIPVQMLQQMAKAWQLGSLWLLPGHSGASAASHHGLPSADIPPRGMSRSNRPNRSPQRCSSQSAFTRRDGFDVNVGRERPEPPAAGHPPQDDDVVSPGGRRRGAGGWSPQGTEGTWWGELVHAAKRPSDEGGSLPRAAAVAASVCLGLQGRTRPPGWGSKAQQQGCEDGQTLHPRLSFAIKEAERKRGTGGEPGRDRPGLSEGAGRFAAGAALT